MASCIVWRKAYTNDRPESFSDRESLIRRNKRVRNVVVICLIAFLFALLAGLIGIGICIYYGKIEKLIELSLETIINILFSCYLSWVVRKIQYNLDR
jgi:cation transporter-like permease